MSVGEAVLLIDRYFFPNLGLALSHSCSGLAASQKERRFGIFEGVGALYYLEMWGYGVRGLAPASCPFPSPFFCA